MARIKIKAKQDFYDTSIEALDLNTRGFNALMRAKITTLDELTDKWNLLEKMHGMGTLTIKQIRNAFIKYYIDTVLDNDEDKVTEFLEGIAV